MRRFKKYSQTVWPVATGELRLTFAEIPSAILDVNWNPNGESIIVETSSGTWLMDVSTGRITAKLPYSRCTGDSWGLFGDPGCATFIFNADGSLFLKRKKPLKLWSSSTGQLLAELKSTGQRAEFSPTDKTVLVTSSKDKGTALLWELRLN